MTRALGLFVEPCHRNVLLIAIPAVPSNLHVQHVRPLPAEDGHIVVQFDLLPGCGLLRIDIPFRHWRGLTVMIHGGLPGPFTQPVPQIIHLMLRLFFVLALLAKLLFFFGRKSFRILLCLFLGSNLVRFRLCYRLLPCPFSLFTRPLFRQTSLLLQVQLVLPLLVLLLRWATRHVKVEVHIIVVLIPGVIVCEHEVELVRHLGSF
mmetsp:Transcript_5645/g.20539  ORF Transcript_5645/g.20539 Transcript_5645/m.20539 type:complete len:205 (+) Transcript_5645:2291-2905(+)